MHVFHVVVHLVHRLSRKVVTMEHLRALVMACKIAWLACAVASVSFLNCQALLFCSHCSFLWVLGKLLVHPVEIKVWARVAVIARARLVALLDSREVVACLCKLLHNMRALRVALAITATTFVAVVSLPHHLVHLSITMIMPVMVAAFVMIASGPVPKLCSHVSKKVSETAKAYIMSRDNN
jgi:hypothetical protein